jgi:hypothetical protein
MANTHIAMVLHTIHDYGDIDVSRVQSFVQLCKYPSKWGKLDKNAFAPHRLKQYSISSFANTLLTMIMVLHLFLEVFVADAMPDVFAAFTKLHHIVGLLRLGAESSMVHIETIQNLMDQHLQAFIELYGEERLKPKWHHGMHIVDGMRHIKKLLACFVTERKHREVKASALHVFRHYEHTVLNDLVNKTFEQTLNGIDLYREQFLVFPADCVFDGHQMRRARKAILRIGEVTHDDLVALTNGTVGKIVYFWQRANAADIIAELECYECINNDARILSTERTTRRFVDVADFVDTLVSFMESPAILRVSLPPALLYS